MNSAYTVDLRDGGQTSQATATDFWRESHERHPEKVFGLSIMANVACLDVSFAVSPVTAMPDPWLLEKRRRDAVVTVSIYQEVIGRFISRSEALRISRHILERAERERMEIAEWEAKRGIQWEVGE